MELRRNPDVIICTPGRLIDLVKNSQAIDLDYIEVVIFDEVFLLYCRLINYWNWVLKLKLKKLLNPLIHRGKRYSSVQP
jgi:hypothetical protein